MQFTLHATRRTPHGASRLVLAMSAWSVKTRRALSRHCRDARVYSHTTTAMHGNEYNPSPSAPAHDPDEVVGRVVELRARVSDAFEVASRLTQRPAEYGLSFGQEVKVAEEIEHLLQRSTNEYCIQRSVNLILGYML